MTQAQIVVCKSAAQVEDARRWFPKLEARYVNGGDWKEIEGRRVVCLDPLLAELALGYAAEVKSVPVEIPTELKDEEIPGWIRANARIWPCELAAPASSPSLVEPTATTAGAAPEPQQSHQSPPEALGTQAHAEEPLPLEAYADTRQSDPGASSHGWTPPDADWPSPVDLWGDSVELPTLTEAHLPPSIYPYLADQSGIKGVDINQSALNALVILAGALHNGHGLRPKAGEADYIERPVLWGACVGSPSTKKGAAQSIAKGPIDEIDVGMRKAVAKAMETRREELASYEQALHAWRKAAPPKGDKPAAPAPVDLPRIGVDNFTMESLRMLEHNPRGKVLMVADELSSLFGNLNAYSASGVDKDRPALLRLYESKSYLVDREADRRNNLPPIYIPSWAACIVGGIQPSVLQRIARRQGIESDGMLARFMLIHVRGPFEGREDEEEDRAEKARYAEIVQRLVDFIPPQSPCQLAPEASEVRKEFNRWLYGRMAATAAETFGESSQAALGKFEGTFSRLCLVYHAIECAAARMPQVSQTIPMDTAIRVRDLIQGILTPHMLATHMAIAGDSYTLRMARMVGEFILAHRVSKLNQSMIHHYCSPWRKLPKNQRVDVMQMLIDMAWLRPMDRYNYRVNPGVAAKYPDRRNAELTRRAQSVENIRQAAEERAPGED